MRPREFALIRCQNCGEEIEANSSFCTSCGSRLAAPTSPRAKRAAPLVPLLVAGALVVAAGAFFLWQRMETRTDPLVELLIRTPIPEASYAGWKLTFAPSISEDDEPEEGQMGKVTAHFDRTEDSGIAGFGFTVFKTPDLARNSYVNATTYDQTQYPKLTPEQLAHLQQSVITPSGFTASCLDGGQRASCNALVGRTVVFVFMDGGQVENAIDAVGALVDHVSALEKAR